MTNEHVDTASKERRHQANHTSLFPCHDACPQFNHWQVTLLFLFNYSHVLPVNHRYVQRIVRATSPQSMRRGAKITNNFYYTRPAILEAIYMIP